MSLLPYWFKDNLATFLGIGFFALMIFIMYLPNMEQPAAPAAQGAKAQATAESSWPDGVSQVITSTTSGPPKYALHVLFLGDSYTFFHDIPHQVADIASSDPGNPTQLVVQSVTRAGAGLKELWEDGKAAQAIGSRHWDYVVLQDESLWPMFPQSIDTTRDYASRFNALIKQTGAKVMLYMTWVRKPGSAWYTDPQTIFLQNPNFMLQRIVAVTQAMAKDMAAESVDVGLYWMVALRDQPDIDLYEPDASQPGTAGSYLAALTFYKALTGRDVTKITFLPNGLAPDAAQKIKTIVSQPLYTQ